MSTGVVMKGMASGTNEDKFVSTLKADWLEGDEVELDG